ncbi:germination protein YpeB [Oceanobacillus alkalisoli]|uniref:germination protein YpeB n=1 Tax=Oceanobacillus alkalisoli TaxID=2925113 RepID=UPI001EF0077A|nr:germination protein YpeB [Oceanobacillus alkalisoli]MCF3941659.1 germination protein YpeB [Oceanobacillus alkalisoli]MCG5102940.1 germination protein YpeB [Oceanobacillus alkalisoli]
MIRWITIGVLSLGLVGAAIWGYQEHQEKNAILIQAENGYQKSFHELSYHMDLLHDEIGTVLAMNSHERLSPKFVDIWRITSEAHSNVSQLPLGLLPFNKTEEFLSNIGDFTYRTAIRNLDDDPLTDEETNVLEELYVQANDIKDELRHVQHLALENNLRWMDVQLALVNNDQTDNTIIDGFKTVEEQVEGFAEANSQSGLIGVSTKPEDHFENLPGETLSEKEALDKSRKIFDINSKENIEITPSGDGADIPIYSVSYQNDDKRAYMDLSQKGGYPLTLLIERPLKDKKLSLHEGLERAEKYLEQFDFDDMNLYQSMELNNVGMYSFYYNQDGIRIYSDSVEVKVALDNGDVLGVTATEYYSNHHEREIDEPELTEEEALEFVNDNVQIEESSLSIITNDVDEEVLTYEFLGTFNNDTYRIFINAMDGREEMVEKLGGKELKYS